MTPPAPAPIRCPNCGAEFPSALLCCPQCQWLVYAAELRKLALAAESAATGGDLSQALVQWRRALELLPPDSTQAQRISERIIALSRQVDELPRIRTHAPPPPPPGGSTMPPNPAATAVNNDISPVTRTREQNSRGLLGKIGAIAGVLLAALWKFKAFAVILLSKGKILLLGLGKAQTFFSMLLSFGVYWTMFGWPFAAGLVLSIYVHEMGHIVALRRYGIKATAPMFIPGFGALILLKQKLQSPREDARVGLAGPIWGLAAALFSAGLWLVTNMPIFAAIAQLGAWINLFNLMPIWQLDGGRGFHALARWQRAVVTAAFIAAYLLIHDGLLILIAIVAGARTFAKPKEAQTDNGVLIQFLLLIAALSAMLHIPVPGAQRF